VTAQTDTTNASHHFLNRELSWLAFNQRVLEQALDPKTPLLERVKFFCITSSNLDEFFEVRVASLKQQIEAEATGRSIDGLTASENFAAVTKRVREMVDQLFECWRDQLLPQLAENGIRFLEPKDLTADDLQWLDNFYRTEIRPVLTPLALDPAHPFPQLLNKSLNIIVDLEMKKGGDRLRYMAVVPVPRILTRLVKLPRPGKQRDYIFMGRVIGQFLGDLFPGASILGYWHFRVTRNSELYIDEEEIANLLQAVETELRNRRRGDAVRLEIDQHIRPEICRALLGTLKLTEDDLYLIDGPINPTRLMAVYEGDHSPELRDAPFIGASAPRLKDQPDLFNVIRQGDVMLHHPYESFESVVDFVEKAAQDPNVLAIKQTMYRTGGDARITQALMDAVHSGKQVTAVVELRARFDEANNIKWARQLEEEGVHVVYGLVGYKIHAKMCLVVRREGTSINRYVHLSTGNYNAATAKIYTDIGLLTCHKDFGEDATNFFNLLTGICQFQETKRLIIAPFQLHEWMLESIRNEAVNARKGLPARIIAKINSLAEPQIIEALYAASQAGVKIDLIVRGTCTLRAQVPGLSENITVRSIVDRFLEHSRIFYFENGCQPLTFVGSADWLPRNFFRRIELLYPVLNGTVAERLKREILDTALADNSHAWMLQADGSYQRLPGKGAVRRSQFEFMERVVEPTRPPQKRRRYPRVKVVSRPTR
jgi:polyphosphate kinase